VQRVAGNHRETRKSEKSQLGRQARVQLPPRRPAPPRSARGSGERAAAGADLEKRLVRPRIDELQQAFDPCRPKKCWPRRRPIAADYSGGSMTHKTAPALAALAMAALACRGGPSSPLSAGAPVVLISIDTLRSDHLPAYGYRARSRRRISTASAATPSFSATRTGPCPMTLPSTSRTAHGPAAPRAWRAEQHRLRVPQRGPPQPADILKKRGYATGAAISSYRPARGDRPRRGVRFL